MYEIFIQYIKRHSTVPLTESEIDLIKSVVLCRKLRRRQYVLYEGEVSKYSAFLGISRETLSRIRSHTLKPMEHHGTLPNFVSRVERK